MRAATGMTMSWAIRSPTAMAYALVGVGVEQGDLDLAAVAGIHRPGLLTIVMPCLAARPLRGTTNAT